MKELNPTNQEWGDITLQDNLFQKFGPCDSGDFTCDRKELSLVYFARDPFTRLLGSYRDKIERLEGRQFFYTTVTQVILRAKYPKAHLPFWGTSWYHGKCNNLTVTFENVVEYITFEQITGFDPDYIPDYENCNIKKLVSPVVSPRFLNGYSKRLSDVHFLPQAELCRICGHKDSLPNVTKYQYTKCY